MKRGFFQQIKYFIYECCFYMPPLKPKRRFYKKKTNIEFIHPKIRIHKQDMEPLAYVSSFAAVPSSEAYVQPSAYVSSFAAVSGQTAVQPLAHVNREVIVQLRDISDPLVLQEPFQNKYRYSLDEDLFDHQDCSSYFGDDSSIYNSCEDN